jgi:hypothetical protein
VELRKFLVPGVRGEPLSWSKELLAKARNIVQIMEQGKFSVPEVRGEPPSWSKELLAKVRNIVKVVELVPGMRGEPPSWSKELLAKVRYLYCSFSGTADCSYSGIQGAPIKSNFFTNFTHPLFPETSFSKLTDEQLEFQKVFCFPGRILKTSASNPRLSPNLLRYFYIESTVAYLFVTKQNLQV